MCSKDLKLPNWLVRNENISQGLMESTKHSLLYSSQLGSAAAPDLAHIWQEGAVPSQRQGLSSDNVGGQDSLPGVHLQDSTQVPFHSRSHLPLLVHTQGLEKTAQSVKGNLYPSCWVWPSSSCTPGSSLLHREEHFAAYAQGTDGGCGSLATQVTGLWLPPP